MSTNLVLAYDGHDMQFRDAGWLNATSVSLRFGKEPKFWLRTAETAGYVCAVADRIFPEGDRRTRLHEIKELRAGNLNSAGAREKLAAFIHDTGLVAVKRGGMDNGAGSQKA